MAAPDDNAGLAAELVGESALSLGRAGARLQAALDALAAHDAAGEPDGEVRRDLVDSAGEQAWGFLVLRNALGWYDDEYALAAYQVPREVRGRMLSMKSSYIDWAIPKAGAPREKGTVAARGRRKSGPSLHWVPGPRPSLASDT